MAVLLRIPLAAFAITTVLAEVDPAIPALLLCLAAVIFGQFRKRRV